MAAAAPPGSGQGLASKARSRAPPPNNPSAGWHPHGMPGTGNWFRPPPPPPPMAMGKKSNLREIVLSGEDLNNLPPNETMSREVAQHLEYLMSLRWPKPEPIFTAAYQVAEEASALAAETVTPAAPPFPQNESPNGNGPPPASETQKDCPEAVDQAMDTSSESSGDGAEAAELLEEPEDPEAPAQEAPAPEAPTQEASAPAAASASSSSTAPAPAAPVPQASPALASSAPSAPSEDAGRSGSKAVKRSLILRPAWRQGAQAAVDLLQRRKLQKAKEGDKVDLTLRQIRYSQDSIMGFFRDKRTVAQMRKELCKGQKLVAQIPKISAVLHDGVIYSQDNRRLWTFKHCGMPENVRIPVVVGRKDDSFAKKLTTPSAGRTIFKRGGGGFD